MDKTEEKMNVNSEENIQEKPEADVENSFYDHIVDIIKKDYFKLALILWLFLGLFLGIYSLRYEFIVIEGGMRVVRVNRITGEAEIQSIKYR